MTTLRVDGADLSYEVRGAGTPIVFLHGLGSDGASWEAQINAFAARYRCITVDFRGSGASRDRDHPRGPFSMSRFAADVHALLQHLDASPAHVVGLSLGGMVAFQLAVDAPSCIRSLVIVNSGPAVVPRTLAERWAMTVRKIVTRVWGPAVFGRILAPKLFPKPEHGQLRERFQMAMAANDKGAYIATLKAILGWSVVDRIGEITAPSLIVAADSDYTSVESKEVYARRMPNAHVVVVADAHHALPLESPQAFNAVLAEFLSEVDGAVAQIPDAAATV
ncbi:MAG: alpha/beta hydrolase [Gemmatimonadaceae bacterium]